MEARHEGMMGVRVLWAGAVLVAAACVAEVDDQAVHGVASGVGAPVVLALAYPGGSERLSITGDGPFAFAHAVPVGSAYTVRLVGDPPCVLDGAHDAAMGMDAEIRLTCDGAVALTSLALSGSTSGLGFSPDRLRYEADVPLLQQSVTLTATPASGAARVTVAGVPGRAGWRVPLALGANAIDIEVVHGSGLQRTYRVVVHRAAALAQHAYLKASNPDRGDWFGEHIALSGDTLAVAAPRESSAARGVGGNQADDRAASSGAVYVFRRHDGIWAQEAYLKASNADTQDAFGKSLALSGDTLAVGAPLEDSAARGVNGDQDDGRAPNSGAVYVFRRHGGAWAQEAYLKASNSRTDDRFGASVALSDTLSGDTLAVGAPFEDSAARGVGRGRARNSGAVYIFQRSGNTWSQELHLEASNADAEDTFGASLAFSGDTLAVGAPGEDSAARGAGGDPADNGNWNSGAVYIYQRRRNVWFQEAYLKASNSDAGDWFGERVALSGDTLAVGAPFEDSAATGVRTTAGVSTATLDDDDSLSASGAVYVFRRRENIWLEEAYIKASNPDAGDWFGASVAVGADLLAVGAPWEASAARGEGGNQTDNSALDSGAIYLFRRSDGIWAQETYLKASNAEAGDWFGCSVAASEGTLAVGASQESSGARGEGGNQRDNGTPGSGAIYFFQ